MNWTFQTRWIDGVCSIDDGPCEYQVRLHSDAWALMHSDFPDVTKLEAGVALVIQGEATTAEELLQVLALSHDYPYRVTVRCRSLLHGILEVSTS